MAVTIFIVTGVARPAGAEAKFTVDPFKGGLDGNGVNKGAEVAGTVVFLQPGEHETG